MWKNNSDNKSLVAQPDAPEINLPTEEGGTIAVVKSNEPRFLAPSHSGVDILKLLTELEDLVENTKRGPMGMMLRFDEDKFHMTIMKIRANLPEEMKRAAKLARESERIAEETREQAERVIENARKSGAVELERGKKEIVHLREQVQAEAAQLREAAQREAKLIQEEAQAAGDQILAEARIQAAQLVADSEVNHQAQAQAQEILAQAQAQAQDILMQAQQAASSLRQGADNYARDILTNLETALSRVAGEVQRGRTLLEGR